MLRANSLVDCARFIVLSRPGGDAESRERWDGAIARADAQLATVRTDVETLRAEYRVALAEATETDISDFVAGQVAHYKQLRHIEFIDAIPKSASGKILRRMLRDPA